MSKYTVNSYRRIAYVIVEATRVKGAPLKLSCYIESVYFSTHVFLEPHM